MNRNEVGKWGAKFRAENDMLHKEMAEKLEMNVSYLSSIEHGRKPVPEDWWKKLSKAFDLSLQETTKLRLAVMRSRQNTTMSVETDYEARLLVAFDQNRASLDEQKTSKIEEIMAE